MSRRYSPQRVFGNWFWREMVLWAAVRKPSTGRQQHGSHTGNIFTSNLSASEKEDAIYRFVNDACDRGMSPALFASFLKFSWMLIVSDCVPDFNWQVAENLMLKLGAFRSSEFKKLCSQFTNDWVSGNTANVSGVLAKLEDFLRLKCVGYYIAHLLSTYLNLLLCQADPSLHTLVLIAHLTQEYPVCFPPPGNELDSSFSSI